MSVLTVKEISVMKKTITEKSGKSKIELQKRKNTENYSQCFSLNLKLEMFSYYSDKLPNNYSFIIIFGKNH